MANGTCARGIEPALVCVAMFAILDGCAAAPAGPRGPLMGPRLEVAGDLSYAYGRGEAVLTDGKVARGPADTAGSDITIVPRRLEGRLSPLSWFDVGLEVGWLGGSIDARIGRPALAGRVLAFNLAAGISTGELGPFKDTKHLRSNWIRLELYPTLPSTDAPIYASQRRFVFALGLHGGTFFHEIPYTTDPAGLDRGGIYRDALQSVRNEVRIETAVGFFRALPGVSLLFAAEPYFVVSSKQLVGLGGCSGCEMLRSYSQSWGIVLVFRGTLRVFPFNDPN